MGAATVFPQEILASGYSGVFSSVQRIRIHFRQYSIDDAPGALRWRGMAERVRILIDEPDDPLAPRAVRDRRLNRAQLGELQQTLEISRRHSSSQLVQPRLELPLVQSRPVRQRRPPQDRFFPGNGSPASLDPIQRKVSRDWPQPCSESGLGSGTAGAQLAAVQVQMLEQLKDNRFGFILVNAEASQHASDWECGRFLDQDEQVAPGIWLVGLDTSSQEF